MTGIRKKLQQGGTAVGSWINTGSPIVAELMAGCGYDFLTVDAEHSPVGIDETFRLFQAIRSGDPGCAPMVRVHGVDYSLVKRFLDAGAEGIIAPLVSTAEQAQLLVETCRYPPEGRRGVGFCRANAYGRNLESGVATANEEILVAIQIEDCNGVDSIDSILEVPGIDAVFLGPYDLSASLGVTGQFDHPAYLEARDKVISACRRHGKIPGIHVVPPNPGEVLDRAREGYRLIAYSLDITLLNEASRSGLSAIRGGLGESPAGADGE